MLRQHGTTRTGQAFDPATLEAVWQRGAFAPGRDPRIWRMDACGALIQRQLHGHTTPLGCGWEVDHIVPVARGGSDALANLQPLQWQNNRAKGDGPLSCPVKAA
jgi:hypothetical protein